MVMNLTRTNQTELLIPMLLIFFVEGVDYKRNIHIVYYVGEENSTEKLFSIWKLGHCFQIEKSCIENLGQQRVQNGLSTMKPAPLFHVNDTSPCLPKGKVKSLKFRIAGVTEVLIFLWKVDIKQGDKGL